VKQISVSMVAISWCLATVAGAQGVASQASFARRIERLPKPGLPARAVSANAHQAATPASANPGNSQQAPAPSTAPKPEEPPRALEANKPVLRDMAGGQTHTYTIQLDSGQFLHVMVDQRGIDVVVSLISPDGTSLAEIDSPSGATGLEPLFWVTDTGGTYKLVVRALEEGAAAGKYEIKMDTPHPPTPQDGTRIQAQRAFIDGRAQMGKQSEGALLTAKLKFQDSLGAWQAVGDSERAQQTMILIDAVYDGLINLYFGRGNFQEAYRIAQQRLEFDTANFGPNSINIVPPMREMAAILERLGAFAESEKIRKEVMTLAQKVKGAESMQAASSLDDLGQLYARQNKYAEAEPLFKRALAICEKTEGPEHKDVANTLSQLAAMYHAQKRYADAQQFYQRAVAIYDKLKEPDPAEAAVLTRSARNEVDQGRYAEAEELDKRAVAISEKALSPEHPAVADSLMEMASVCTAEKKYSEAETADQRALAIYDKAQGPVSLGTSRAVIALLGVYSLEGKQAETEPLIQRIQTLVAKTPNALKWLRGGTAQKDGVGFQYALGALYEKGQGVKQDYAEARKWYDMAAENGAALACVSLARLHENGLGVAKDNVEAYKWYSLAGPGHQDWDEHKKQLVAQLSKDQLNDAQQRVAAWQKQHPSKP